MDKRNMGRKRNFVEHARISTRIVACLVMVTLAAAAVGCGVDDGDNGISQRSFAVGGPGGIPIGSCTIADNGDGSATITCKNGTVITLKDGTRCTVADTAPGTHTLSCDDGTSAVILDGEDGQDGRSCTVIDNANGTKTVACDDGTSAVVRDGADGKSCSVIDNGNGTKTLACSDGTSVVVSDGAAGADGRGALVQTQPEPPGASCPAGGVAVLIGVDANGNGVLDPTEVAQTSHVCHGVTGPAGQTGADGKTTLVQIQSEPTGATCPAGGTVVKAGIDQNGNGVLDPAEATQTTYVCHGAQGAPGNDGTSCTVVDNGGGSKIIACSDGTQVTLTDGEDGEDGQDGLTSLIRLDDEAPGVNCPNGGVAIKTGVDLDRDGVLQDGEVTQTKYVCQDLAVQGVPVVSPTTLNFGNIFCLGLVAGSVTIANTGNAPFVWTTTLGKGPWSPYAVAPASGVVQPGGQVQVSVGPAPWGLDCNSPKMPALDSYYDDSLIITTTVSGDLPHLVQVKGSLVGKEINPGLGYSGSSDPGGVNVNGLLYFGANDGTHGYELWKSDGTSVGTVMVKDIAPNSTYSGVGSSNPSYLTNVNGTLFFTAISMGRRELWKSDGTEAGTVMVKNGGYSYDWEPTHLTNVNGTLFFRARITGYADLWKSDGTEAGTVLVKNIYPGSSSDPSTLTNVKGTLYFTANNGTHGYELWKSDGTETGTVMVKDINPGSAGAYPGRLTDVNGTLYFSANDGTHGYQLWKSDGTEAGTVSVINPELGYSSPNYLVNVNGLLYFSVNDGTHGDELWKSDGTEAGTVMVKDINPGSNSASPGGLTDVKGTLYFTATNGIDGIELWKSDGTETGTVMVKDLSSFWTSYLGQLTNVNGTLYFTANEGTHGEELWKSDGTEAGTRMVADINPGSASSSVRNLTDVNGTLFFSADNGTNGRELYWVKP
jgi:ELWxxDGT repeat protein